MGQGDSRGAAGLLRIHDANGDRPTAINQGLLELSGVTVIHSTTNQ